MTKTIAVFLHQPTCSTDSVNGVMAAFSPMARIKLFTKHKVLNGFFDDVDVVVFPGGDGEATAFRHVLKPGGLAHIIVPDLQELMLACVQQGIDLDGLLYESPMGPITPLDVLYGHSGMIQHSGQDFYAHRTGFSRSTLANVAEASGFGPMFCQQGNLELNLITFNGDPDPELAALFDLPMAMPDSPIA